jgi:hypothetical protein
MALYSIRGYARHRGVSHPAVLKAIDSGRIRLRKDGRIDAEQADRAWALNTNLTKPRNAVTGNPKTPLDRSRGGGAGGPGAVGPEEERIVSGWAAARSLREAFAAKREKLAYEREAGLLVPLEQVRAQAFDAGRRVRDALRQLPNRLAPMLIGIENVEDAHKILSAEIDRALLELERLRPEAPAAPKVRMR